MGYTFLGDIVADSTIHIYFNTTAADGTPTALADTPTVAAYVNGSAAQSTAGLTLTEGFDSVTGLNVVTVDTSADAFYAAGSSYMILLTAGTVDSVSVVGSAVGGFSIARSAAMNEIGAAGVGLTEAGGDGDHLTEAGGDGDHLTEAGATGDHLTAIPWNSSWGAEVQSEVNDALVVSGIDSVSAIAQAVWNRSRDLHNTQGTFGESFNTLVSGTVGSGSTTTTIESDLSETTPNHYNGRLIAFITGSLSGQFSGIKDYDGAGTLTITQSTEAPSSGDRFLII